MVSMYYQHHMLQSLRDPPMANSPPSRFQCANQFAFGSINIVVHICQCMCGFTFFIVQLVHIWQHKYCGSHLLAWVHISQYIWFTFGSITIVVHICQHGLTFHAWSGCTFQTEACKCEQKHQNANRPQACSHPQANRFTFAGIYGSHFGCYLGVLRVCGFPPRYPHRFCTTKVTQK